MAERPPRDITPERFFREWLPAKAEQKLAGFPRALLVRVRLDGEGGGAWDLHLDKGKLDVTEAGTDEPELLLMQTVADWRAIVAGEEGGPDLAPAEANPADLMLIDPQAVQILDTVKGTLRFEVTGYKDRTWALTVKIGTQPLADPPTATIQVDAETSAAMLARKLPPPQAFFEGKLKLLGDANLAMQLGMALMPRFG